MRADLRGLRTAIESYHVDHNQYPPMTDHGPEDNYVWPDGRVESLGGTLHWHVTTPVAYIQYFEWKDPFTWPVATLDLDLRIYTYHRRRDLAAGSEPIPPPVMESLYGVNWNSWMLWSLGPAVYFPGAGQDPEQFRLHYDPTNGTISKGSLFEYGP